MKKSGDAALMPCPFCGATELLQTDRMVQEYSEAAAESLAHDGLDGEPEDEWFVVCGDCGAMGPTKPSAEAAQAAWNRRA